MALFARGQQLFRASNSRKLFPIVNRFISSFVHTPSTPEPLAKTSEDLILKRPWATYPFEENAELKMPIYSLLTGEFTEESVSLDHQHFNQPLRRDFVHSLYVYESKYGKRTYKTTLTKGTVAGSGKKPAPQKGRGKARLGNRQSPLLRGGGKAHGKVPRDFTIRMNSKVMLQAIKVLLSAMLYENRLIFVDSEGLETHKTKYLNAVVKNYKENNLLFLTPIDLCNNFKLAAANIKNVKHVDAKTFNATDATKTDFMLVTKQGLIELETVIEGREYEYYRLENSLRPEMEHDRLLGNRLGARPDIIDKVLEDFDQSELDFSQDFKLYSKALEGYLDKAEEYDKHRREIQDSEDMLWVNKQD